MRILGYVLSRKQTLTAHGEHMAPKDKPYIMYIKIAAMASAGNINGQRQQVHCLQALGKCGKFGPIILRASD